MSPKAKDKSVEELTKQCMAVMFKPNEYGIIQPVTDPHETEIRIRKLIKEEREKREEAEKLSDLRLSNTVSKDIEASIQRNRADKAEAQVKELEDSHDRLSKVLSKATLVETNDRIKELEAEVERLKARETYLENLGTARFKDMHKVQAKLSKAVEAFQELKHQNHHTIEEEMWRIDKVLKDLEES